MATVGAHLAKILQEFLDDHDNLGVSDIARESGLAPLTISKIMHGTTERPHPNTVEKIENSMAKLSEAHGGHEDGGDDSESEEDENSWWQIDENIGTTIKSIRVFDPHDREQVRAMMGMVGVYMFYAGDNNQMPSHSDKVKLVGTPEYIGSADNLGSRIKQWANSGKWWWRDDFIDTGVVIEVDNSDNPKLHRELEKILIRVLTPQINRNEKG